MLESEVSRWGFGVTQTIKPAEMGVYAIFNHYAIDLQTAQATSSGAIVNTTAETRLEDWVAVTAGARINF